MYNIDWVVRHGASEPEQKWNGEANTKIILQKHLWSGYSPNMNPSLTLLLHAPTKTQPHSANGEVTINETKNKMEFELVPLSLPDQGNRMKPSRLWKNERIFILDVYIYPEKRERNESMRVWRRSLA